jgi:hypothetical protein
VAATAADMVVAVVAARFKAVEVAEAAGTVTSRQAGRFG